MTDDTADRVRASKDVLGHVGHYGPMDEAAQREHLPVIEGEHYDVLASTLWADYHVPTVVEWAHGEVDDFTDREESMKNRWIAKHTVAEPRTDR